MKTELGAHLYSFFEDYLKCQKGLRPSSLKTYRKNHVRTRNQRLAAVRGFFDYLARRVPGILKEAPSVAAVPTKRTTLAEMFFRPHFSLELGLYLAGDLLRVLAAESGLESLQVGRHDL